MASSTREGLAIAWREVEAAQKLDRDNGSHSAIIGHVERALRELEKVRDVQLGMHRREDPFDERRGSGY